MFARPLLAAGGRRVADTCEERSAAAPRDGIARTVARLGPGSAPRDRPLPERPEPRAVPRSSRGRFQWGGRFALQKWEAARKPNERRAGVRRRQRQRDGVRVTAAGPSDDRGPWRCAGRGRGGFGRKKTEKRDLWMSRRAAALLPEHAPGPCPTARQPLPALLGLRSSARPPGAASVRRRGRAV